MFSVTTDAGVVTNVRRADTAFPGDDLSALRVGVGWIKQPDDTFAPPAAPAESIEPIVLPRWQFQMALERKGLTGGLDNATVTTAVQAIADSDERLEAQYRVKDGQAFSSDEGLIIQLAAALSIAFDRDDFVNAAAGNWSAITP